MVSLTPTKFRVDKCILIKKLKESKILIIVLNYFLKEKNIVFFLVYSIKKMGGGLMQLVAYGAQDIYLTGNPQITFFKVVYRRHTNFAMESIEQTMSGTADFGGSATVTISRNGDLVSRMYLEINPSEFLTNLDTRAHFITPYAGHSIIKEVVLEIGGQQIDKHYGHWLNVWSELTELNPSGKIGAVAAGGGDEPAASSTLYQRMSYNHQGADLVAGSASGSGTIDAPSKAFVPLQFWFCRNPGLALPLIALQYHEVKVKIDFETAARIFETAANLAATSLASTKLWVDYIYLDTDERRRFAQVSHEYLIEQLQFQNYSGTAPSKKLNFNHPVKELVFTTPGVTNTTATTGFAVPGVLAGTYQLKLNGHDRFAARDFRYFTRTQVWQHHTGFGGVNVKDSIGVYSFALKPEEHQPSGTCNFSRIDNAQLVQGTGAVLNVYAVNYNVLRIMSGMGGLAYSN